jgi:hypothetical protein
MVLLHHPNSDQRRKRLVRILHDDQTQLMGPAHKRGLPVKILGDGWVAVAEPMVDLLLAVDALREDIIDWADGEVLR